MLTNKTYLHRILDLLSYALSTQNVTLFTPLQGTYGLIGKHEILNGMIHCFAHMDIWKDYRIKVMLKSTK